MDADFSLAIVCAGFGMANVNLFLFCYFGKYATESFEKMAECLYESEWQGLATDLQKYLILMIGNAQRPLFYNGNKMINLKLETYCTVSQVQFFDFL